MTEAEWLACVRPLGMLEEPGTRRSARKRRLFAAACCRRLGRVVSDGGMRAADAAEAFADGAATADQLAAAQRRVGLATHPHRQHAAEAALTASCSPGYDPAVGAAKSAAIARAMVPGTSAVRKATEWAAQADLVRDIFGNPFRPVTFPPSWLTFTVTALARQMYETRDFSAMPILADALQDAGCENDDILDHCRGPGPHVRGCWVVDLVLGKE
jgi:hypothetical protein